MGRVRKAVFAIDIASFVACCALLLLLNWSALGFKTLSIPTGSMRPAIPPGSLVLVHKVPLSSLKVGDVITHINPADMGMTLTHRIVKISKIDGKVPVFTTKGDANAVADIPTVGGLVQGEVVWHIPYLGRLMLWAKSWTGIGVLVYLPALLLMAEEVRRLADYLRSLQPYYLYGRFKTTPKRGGQTAATAAAVLAVIVGAALLSQPVLALIRSNTVKLTDNTISVAATGQCGGSSSNDNNVTVGNKSRQKAKSGSASSSGNTDGGSANSGDVSNSGSSSTTVTITNGC